MITLVNTSMGLIIGERMNSEKDVISLLNPRHLVMETDDKKITRFAIGEFPWKPAVFSGGSGLVSYDVTEENLLATYRQAVSGLILPETGEILKTALR
jgi:hypothetical protein